MSGAGWKYESRRERRRRQIMAFQEAASRAIEPMSRGDVRGAREALRDDSLGSYEDDGLQRLPDPYAEPDMAAAPTPRISEGMRTAGTKVLDFVGKTNPLAFDPNVPDRAPEKKERDWKDIGLDLAEAATIGPVKGALKAADKGREYVGGPAFSLITGATGQETEIDPRTGQRYRSKPSLADWGRGFSEAFTRDPRETYKEARQATNERLADPELTAFERTLLGGFQDPLTYIPVGTGPAITRALLPRVGSSVARSRAARAAFGLLESPGRTSLGGVLGAATGAQVAEEQEWGPGASLAATLGGGLLGGAIAARGPTRLGQDLAHLQGREGRQPALGLSVEQMTAEEAFGGAPPMAAPVTAAQRAEDAALGLPDYDNASVLALPDLTPQPLTRHERLMELIRTTVGMEPSERIATTAMRARQLLQPRIESQANLLAAKVDNIVRSAFRFDEHGRIQDVVGTPTIQDMAARYPEFEPFLSTRQRAAMAELRAEVEPWQRLLQEAGVEHGTRRDIIEGGFYLPRGRADLEGADAPRARSGRGRPGGRAGFERHADERSMREMIEEGHEYHPFLEVMQSFGMDAGRRAVDNHVADYLRNVTDEDGNLLATTPADRMNPSVRAQWQDLTRQMVNLRARLITAQRRARVATTASDEVDDALQRFVRATPTPGGAGIARIGTQLAQQGRRGEQLAERAAREAGDHPTRNMTGGGPVRVDMPATPRQQQRAAILEARAEEVQRVVNDLETNVPEDVDRLRFLDTALQQTATRAETLAQRGGAAGERAQELMAAIENLRDQIDAFRPAYRAALDRAAQTPRGQARIDMGGLEGHAFPEQMAMAANRFIDAERPLTGRGAAILKTVEAFNQLLRGVRATLDISFMGIQGAIGAARNPVAYGKALALALRSWGDPDVVGAFARQFDQQAMRRGRPTSREWASHGLRFSGNQTEFSIGGGARGLSHRIGQLPGVKQSNRSFANFGDILRLQLADAAYGSSKFAGFDMTTPAARESIADVVNRATGWSRKRFAGDAGEVFLFAPRFFQSQIEFLAQAASPRLNNPGSIEAKRMLGQFIGAGVLLTLLANEYGPGEGIPMEEVLDPNDPNFMRFRIDGQDASIFGPWDSLVKGVMKTAQGDYGYFARTKASPAVSLAWNALTGQTFTGDDFSPSSPGTMLRETVAPFSLSDSVLLGGDKSLEQTAIGMTGTKTTPMTPSEELGQISRAKFGKDYRDLSASQKKTIKDEHPEVWERVVERSDKLLVQSEEVKNRYIAEQKARNDDLLSGRLTLEEWREAKDDAAARKDGEMAQIYKDKDFDSRDKIMDAYYTMLDSATVNGVFDHAARESYLASLSESDRKHIEDNTGLYATPLEKLDRRLRTEYYDLPQHRGFTADESRDIDELWTMVRNNARGTEIPFMLRSLRLADTSGYSEKVIRGVRRRILGYLRLAKDRERYRKKNPAADALLSQGALTADMAAAIEAEID